MIVPWLDENIFYARLQEAEPLDRGSISGEVRGKEIFPLSAKYGHWPEAQRMKNLSTNREDETIKLTTKKTAQFFVASIK
jgi:hypothetical protein